MKRLPIPLALAGLCAVVIPDSLTPRQPLYSIILGLALAIAGLVLWGRREEE